MFCAGDKNACSIILISIFYMNFTFNWYKLQQISLISEKANILSRFD